MSKTLLTLHHTPLVEGEEQREPKVCFFSKKPFIPGALMATFDGQPVELNEALRREFRLADDFKRPAVADRVALGEWLAANGVTRTANYQAYLRLFSELGAGLDAGIRSSSSYVNK